MANIKLGNLLRSYELT